MATVPSSRTWVAGEIVTAAYMNNTIRDVENYLLAPPIFKGYQTVSQTLTTAVNTAITLDSEAVDSAGGHSTVTNTSRYTAVYAGWYQCSGGISYLSNATGIRLTRFNVNGSAQADSDVLVTPVSGNTTRMPTRTTILYLNVGDYVELVGAQTSGGNLGTSVVSGEQSDMVVLWISN